MPVVSRLGGCPNGGAARRLIADSERVRRQRALGMLAGASETLGYATEALLLAGDLDGAQRQLEEALQIADKLGERVYLPQLFLLKLRSPARAATAAAADASVRRAIAEAEHRRRRGSS